MRPSLFFTTSLTLSSHHLRHGGVRVRAASSSLHSITKQNDGTIIIEPNDGRHSASVILCHGLGDTADGWAQPAQVSIMIYVIMSLYYLCIHINIIHHHVSNHSSTISIVLGKSDAICKVHPAHSSNTTSYIKYGNGYAILVRYCWTRL